jgi:hypothetical protein
MSKDDLIKAAIQAVVAGDDEAAVDVANKVIAEGLDPIEIIGDGFAAGMIKVICLPKRITHCRRCSCRQMPCKRPWICWIRIFNGKT